MADDDLIAEIRDLRSEVDALRRRVSTLESVIDDEAVSGEQTAGAPESGRDRSPDQGESGDGSGTDERTRNWERDVGITWLGRVGSVALVVGIVFFIRVAIEAGILGPLGRVVVGAVGGGMLLVGGRYATHRRGYKRWGRITAGTGLAITFFSVYAAYGFDSYRAAIDTPLPAVLLGLTALVGVTIAVSVYDGDPLVAGEAFLLGYATAYLGLDSGSFVITPAYALLLALGLISIATVRPWSRYVAISVLPTYGLVVAWVADFEPAWGIVAGVVVAAFAIYAAGSVLARSDRPDVGQGRVFRAITPLNAVFAAALLEWTVRRWVPELPVEGAGIGAVALALVGIYAGTARRDAPRDDTAGAAAVVFAGVSVVLATGTFAATVGLLAILCGAVAVASYADADALRTGAHLVTTGTVLKLLAIDARQLAALSLAEPLTTAAGRPAAFLLVITVCYGLAWWFRGDGFAVPGRDEEWAISRPYLLTATALTVVGIGLEVSGFGLSVAWAVFGAVLFGGGLGTESRLFRLQGVVVFGVTTAKVFLFDTQGLDTVARSISFLALGAILLAASYAYARWQGDRPLDRLPGP